MLATAVGAVLYLLSVGGLVWLVGLVLSETPTRIVAVILSIVGLPLAGPTAYRLCFAHKRTRNGR